MPYLRRYGELVRFPVPFPVVVLKSRMKSPPAKTQQNPVSGFKLTRACAEKICAVEGLRLNEQMALWFAEADARGLSPDERREQIRAMFARIPQPQDGP